MLSSKESLTDACVQSWIAAPTDPRALYALSTDELVTLTARLLTVHQGVKRELTDLKLNYQKLQWELSDLTRDRYEVEPSTSDGRVPDELFDQVEQVRGAWRVVPAPAGETTVPDMESIWCMGRDYAEPGSCWISWNKATHKTSYQPAKQGHDVLKSFGSQSIISSALLLYRLGCLFECQVDMTGPASDKGMWLIDLQHKASGFYVGFGDHKGGTDTCVSKFPPSNTSFDEDLLLCWTFCTTHNAHTHMAALPGVQHEHMSAVGVSHPNV